MRFLKYIFAFIVIASVSWAFRSNDDNMSEASIDYCKNKSLLKKVGVGDTAFVVSSTNGLQEKIAVTRLGDGRYMAIQYKDGGKEIFQDYTVDRETYHKACALEEKMSKGTADCGKTEVTISWKGKSYTKLDKSCPDKTIDKMKAILFLVQGK